LRLCIAILLGLQISPGMLQHLRDTGQIPFTKLGSIIYYEQEAIKDMMGQSVNEYGKCIQRKQHRNWQKAIL